MYIYIYGVNWSKSILVVCKCTHIFIISNRCTFTNNDCWMTIGDTGEYGGLIYKPNGQFGEPSRLDDPSCTSNAQQWNLKILKSGLINGPGLSLVNVVA